MKLYYYQRKHWFSQWTNHIDVRHHFIRDYVEDKTVKFYFFHLEENMADPFKNIRINGPFELLT